MYSVLIPHDLTDQKFCFTHVELFILFVALKVCGKDRRGRKLLIKLDNMTAVRLPILDPQKTPFLLLLTEMFGYQLHSGTLKLLEFIGG